MRKVLVFIYDEMADFEMTYACHLIGARTDIEIVTIAYEADTVKSMSGIEYRPKTTVKAVLNAEADGIIIPGGMKGEVREELMQLINDMYSKGKLVAAICAGPRYLAKAGILEHVKYTTSIQAWTEDHRARYNEEDPFPRENFVMERVVKDRNVITSQGYSFVDFSVEICEWFGFFTDKEERREFERMAKGL